MIENLSSTSEWYIERLILEGRERKAGLFKERILEAQRKRQEFIDTVLGGDANRIFSADKNTKDKFNELGAEVVKLNSEALDAFWKHKETIADAAEEEDVLDTIEFLRDPRENRFADLVKGWYQNSAGDLFHYDGVIWDKVPSEKVQELEFLG